MKVPVTIAYADGTLYSSGSTINVETIKAHPETNWLGLIADQFGENGQEVRALIPIPITPGYERVNLKGSRRV